MTFTESTYREEFKKWEVKGGQEWVDDATAAIYRRVGNEEARGNKACDVKLYDSIRRLNSRRVIIKRLMDDGIQATYDPSQFPPVISLAW